jgi:hypothetical protein
VVGRLVAWPKASVEPTLDVGLLFTLALSVCASLRNVCRVAVLPANHRGSRDGGAAVCVDSYNAREGWPSVVGPWVEGQPAPYLLLALAFKECEGTTKRLKIGTWSALSCANAILWWRNPARHTHSSEHLERTGDILTCMFRSVFALSPVDLLPTCYLSINKLAPDFEVS